MIKDEQELDHPDQAMDTPLPDNKTNRKAFAALQEAYPGDPEFLGDPKELTRTIRAFAMGIPEVLYPWGYQRALVPMWRLKELARFDLMEPTYAAALEAYLVSKGGEMGIGGAFRTTQPDKPGFAPDGRSFHQLQLFSDGTKWFMAVDAVMRNGSNIHRSPRWSEVPQQGSGNPDISTYGIHANVGGEPWHLQGFTYDGWETWVNNGRKRLNPVVYPIKVGTVPPPPTQPDGSTIAPGTRELVLTDPQMYGIDVAFLQQVLTKAGWALKDDGYYGPASEAAVKDFQSKNNLGSDGKVGPKTWAVIISLAAPPPPPPPPPPVEPPPTAVDVHAPGSRTLKLTSPTMKGIDVAFVQSVMRDEGLAVSIDGVYGRQTRDKVMIVQGWNNLTKDGVVGPETWPVFEAYSKAKAKS